MSTELILLKPQNDVSNPELSIVIPAANEQKTIQDKHPELNDIESYRWYSSH